MILFSLRVCVVIGLFGAGAALAAARTDCPVPDDAAAGTPSALARVAAGLQPGKTLRVLAVGSATMFGPEASLASGTVTAQSLNAGSSSTGPLTGLQAPQVFNREASERAFPRQMAKNLRALVPGAEVEVTVRGGRGLPATDMLALMRTELAAKPYQLVIWQTGTVEAVRNLPPSEFAQTLSDGLAVAEAANANMVLVDPQFSRFLQTNSNLEPYTQVLQQVASLPGVALFRRFDLMRSWANDGHIDMERASRNDRQKVVDGLHACLGVHLARLIYDSSRL